MTNTELHPRDTATQQYVAKSHPSGNPITAAAIPEADRFVARPGARGLAEAPYRAA